MPKAFFKSLLWALGLHGGLLGILLFVLPYSGHSNFPLDRYRIFKISLVDPPKPIPLFQGEAPKTSLPGKTVQTGKTVNVPESESPALSKGKTPAPEEKPNLPVDEKGEKGGIAGTFSLQVIQKGPPSEGRGSEGQSNHSGVAQGKAFSLSSSQGTALASSMATPRYNLNRRPYYPATAREQGWQGTAQLKVLILKNGSVGSLEIEQSSGFSVLDQSALKGVKEWKFYPGLKDGRPTEMWVRIPVTFRLE